MTSNHKIRRLTAADAALYRDLRLEGLKTTPQAFTAAYEIESLQPLDWFAERLSRFEVLGGALEEGPICGVLGLATHESPRKAHMGDVFGVYLQPHARGSGLAKALLAAVINLARGRLEALTLGVGAYNEPAQKLYQQAGFRPVALLERELRVGDVYYDEILMRMDL